MAKEFFLSKTFSPASAKIVKDAEAIFDNYESQDLILSLRQIYYVFIAKDLFPDSWIDREYNLKHGLDPDTKNTEKNYKNFGRMISEARCAGMLDWDMLEDRGRTVSQNPHWENPKEFMSNVAPQFRTDLWADQKNYVMVMVEKQALEGVLEPLCSDEDVEFAANKGYTSDSAIYRAALRLRHQANRLDKRPHVIYLGDHDPSGIDMTRDIADRLALFGRMSIIEVHRVALNLDQVRKLRPPENPAKLTDPRAEGYIERFGRKSWELDAIEPLALADLVRKKIQELRDPVLWDKALQRERAMRAELVSLASKSKYN